MDEWVRSSSPCLSDSLCAAAFRRPHSTVRRRLSLARIRLPKRLREKMWTDACARASACAMTAAWRADVGAAASSRSMTAAANSIVLGDSGWREAAPTKATSSRSERSSSRMAGSIVMASMHASTPSSSHAEVDESTGSPSATSIAARCSASLASRPSRPSGPSTSSTSASSAASSWASAATKWTSESPSYAPSPTAVSPILSTCSSECAPR
mmetsp:Transcript_28872/g.67134  ORF Transcript_28872/g.67134 Transcript_28872/m.67134 type:complete len:212 (+) Transcript_28872:417-1052(+)